MTFRSVALALAAGTAFVATPGAQAQETIKLTVVAGHPPLTIGVRYISEFLIPEVDERLAETGDYEIDWVEAYGGTLAKTSGVLEAVQQGVGDVGYVPALLESDKLPLEQITYVTPFGTDDLPKLLGVVRQLRDEVPELNATFERYDQKLMASVGIDTYHLLSNFEIEGLDDLDGNKFATAGPAANWLDGTGAIPVAAALPDFYNGVETGVYDGIVTFESAVEPYKFHEIAPHVTRVNFGAQASSVLTFNQSRWDSLPDEVRAVFQEVAKDYETRVAEAYRDAGEESLAKAEEDGAEVTSLPDGEREEFAARLPNIARQWADELDSRGLPGTETLERYMELSREAGIEHARAWDEE